MSAASSVLIGVGASAAAAALLSTGTIVQALDARLVDRRHGMRLSMLGRLLSRRRWVLGTLIGFLAFPFQLVALAHASLVIVQPVQASGLLLLLAAGAWLFRERVGLWDLLGVAAIAAGLVLFTWGAPTGRDPPTSEAAMAGAAGGLLLLALVPYFFRDSVGKRMLILSASIGFAGTNMAVKGISHDLTVHDYAFAAAYVVAAALGSTIGVLSQMTAFQRHRAIDVVPLTFSIPTFLPALVGLVVLRENFATVADGGWLFALGAALLLAGTAGVSRSAPVASVSVHATEPAAPHQHADEVTAAE
ncbi:MAG TPA: hypothetical protein VG365_06690 [Solirubrobacteraceae bacterium]|nr:hypothetical protein [Solirubrobacteraceae bacterium]